ncbi:MAG TPA: hypothetical protein VIC05_06355 [Solirubrobacteraceae bacterium]|jgi:Na+-transporting NADH:ubiquinone oxidoreductase subunit NqrE
MSLKRVRIGELIAVVGTGCIVASLVLPWYENATGKLDAWQTFGPSIVLLIVACVAALWLVIAVITERSSALPIAAAVWCTLFAFIAVIAALFRVFERPQHAHSMCVAPWLALAGAFLILIGAWQSLRDERADLYSPGEAELRKLPVS